MAARWTDKHAILRDLAFAQGSAPLDIDNTISHNEKPPREIYQEETEKYLYSDCIGNRDFTTGPDIGIIKELLNEVRDKNDMNNAEISNLNINYQSSGPSDLTPRLQDSSQENTKKRKNRNAAMISLIETYGENNQSSNQDSNRDNKLDLLKPNDFVRSNDKPSSQDKDYTENALMSPSNMFRKKTNIPNGASAFQKKESAIEKVTTCENKSEVYVPSSMAKEYYEKYVEKSKMKETLNEGIWARLEKEMRAIDERRKNEKESLKSPTNSESLSEADSTSSTSLVKEQTS